MPGIEAPIDPPAEDETAKGEQTMAHFTVNIDMDNAAFDDAPATEIGRILREIADEVEGGRLPPFKAQDANGNTVATVIDWPNDEGPRPAPDWNPENRQS